MNENGRHGSVEWAATACPLPGQSVCGDSFIAVGVDDHTVLLGVVDGLGHGQAAAAAANCAVQVLTRSAGRPLEMMMRLCHREMATTRGAAITLVSIDFRTDMLQWVGVGNVAAVLMGRSTSGVASRSAVRLSGGIVGYRMPELPQTEPVAMRPGSLLIMTTDGIANPYVDGVDFAASADALAQQIMGEHNKQTDDALVLVARHRGTS